MELPARLRQAVDPELDGMSLDMLRAASERLTRRYRAETRDGTLHLDDATAALAYAAARLPATYAAIRASMDHAEALLPDFAPSSLLDFGAGPGSALWAAGECWPSLKRAVMLDASPSIRALGERLARDLDSRVDWCAFDIARDSFDGPPADLVTMAYVLDELAPPSITRLVAHAWEKTSGLLLAVEPGTPAGWRRILGVRDQLLGLGGHLVAPCAHKRSCPLVEPDWCHFARRVSRSQIHRLTKRGDVPWEDEKFIYLAVSRQPVEARPARVLAPPRSGSGKVKMKLCCPDGQAVETLMTKRDGDLFKRARRAEWGDALDLA